MRAQVQLPRRRGDDAGFTLVECLVAALVVGIGLMATFGLVDASSKTQAGGRAREGANNLARSFLESVRTSAYSAVNDSYVISTLQALPGWQSTSGMTAVVRQRKIDYTVAVSVCSIDDPKDNLGTADGAFCDGGHAPSATKPRHPSPGPRASSPPTGSRPATTAAR